MHYTRQARSFRTAWFRVKKYRDDEQREWKDILGGTRPSELDTASRTRVGKKAHWEYEDLYANRKCNTMCLIVEVRVLGSGNMKWEEVLYGTSAAVSASVLRWASLEEVRV